MLTLQLQRRRDGIIDLAFAYKEERARANCGIRPKTLEPVGEAVDGNRKICAGMRVEPLGKVLTATAEDGEVKLEGCVET